MSVAAKGDVAALINCCAGLVGPVTSGGSLTPMNSFRVFTRRPGRFTLIEILWMRWFLARFAQTFPLTANSQ